MSVIPTSSGYRAGSSFQSWLSLGSLPSHACLWGRGGRLETITLGDKRIGIRTSMLEEKATACSMLCCYADELQEGFLPWIDEVRRPMRPVHSF